MIIWFLILDTNFILSSAKKIPRNQKVKEFSGLPASVGTYEKKRGQSSIGIKTF